MTAARAAAIATTCLLALTACSGAGTDDTADGKGEAREVEPRWTTIEIDDKALPDRPIQEVGAAISRSARLPVMVVGTVAQPGGATRAVVWHPSRKGSGPPRKLPVQGDDTWADGVAQVGTRTYLWGSKWTDGRLQSFLLESPDRRTWEPVNLPGSLPERDLMIATIVDDGTRHPLALAASNDEVVSIDLRTDSLTTLPSVGASTSYGVSGAVSHGGRVLVLVAARDERGKDRVTALISQDGGRSWSPGGTLGGTEATASGATVSNDRFVVTGSTLDGDRRRAVAWSSSDGRRWQQETVPGSTSPGWTSWLTAPVARGATVSAAFVNNERTWAAILRRSPNGQWRSHGVSASDWRYPGTDATLAFDGSDLVVARSAHGAFQIGHHLDGRPYWGFVTHDAPPATVPVEGWTSAGADGGRMMLIGARTVLRWDDPLGLSWERHTKLAPFEIRGHRLSSTGWSPAGAEDLADVASASAPDGTEVLVGEHVSHDRRGRLEVRLIGWTRRPGDTWTRLRGLGSAHTTYLTDVEYVDGEWIVTGIDADDTSGGPSRAAVWTSTDRRVWRRGVGPFDLGRARDSRISGICRLPNGDLLAVGTHDDPTSSSRPLALRRHAGTWARVRLNGLPDDVTSLSSCSSVGDATILDGWRLDEAHWVTRDGATVDELTIGGKGDIVGPVQATADGFVAAGLDLDQGQAQPVVWLSRDGQVWDPVSVPTESWYAGASVDLWGDRVVVTLSRPSGPGAVILENLDDLLPPP